RHPRGLIRTGGNPEAVVEVTRARVTKGGSRESDSLQPPAIRCSKIKIARAERANMMTRTMTANLRRRSRRRFRSRRPSVASGLATTRYSRSDIGRKGGCGKEEAPRRRSRAKSAGALSAHQSYRHRGEFRMNFVCEISSSFTDGLAHGRRRLAG